MFLATQGVITMSREWRRKTIMADLLMDAEARLRLAAALWGKSCPDACDRQIFEALKQGERTALPLERMAEIERLHGRAVVDAWRRRDP